MRIDAHQHFWDLARLHYSWMPPDPSPLRRDYLPEDLLPILQGNRFDGSVVVQANTVIQETHWLLELAARHDFIKGVVGWVELRDPALGHTLDELQKHPKFKGVRHLVHDEPDFDWLLREDVIRGLQELARRDLPYDLLLRPIHLGILPELAAAVPGLRMVIDHIAKPNMASKEPVDFDFWARDMETAARIPGMHCKLSGMITEAGGTWSADSLRPFVQHVYQVFGPDRLMFGSDWPVCLLAGSWKEVLAAFTQSLGPIEQEKREKMLGETATKFYQLGGDTL